VAAGRQPIPVRPGPRRLANPAAELLPHGDGPAWPGRLSARRGCQVPQKSGVMRASWCRQERRGSFHGRAGVSEKRAPPSLVLVCCIGAIALLAGASRTLAPKVLVQGFLSLFRLLVGDPHQSTTCVCVLAHAALSSFGEE